MITNIYTGEEALEWLKNNSKNWASDILEAKEELKRLRRIYKLEDDMEAYNRFLRTIGAPVNAKAMISAIYLKKKQERLTGEHITLESRAYRIEEQLQALALTDWSDHDKTILSDFYHGRLADINDRVNAIVLDMIVIGATDESNNSKLIN